MVTSATEVGNTRPSAPQPESVAKIHEVTFYSLTSSSWDDLSAMNDGFISPDSVDTNFRDAQAFEHPCMPLSKIISAGSFYYAYDTPWDLSSRLSVRLSRATREPYAARDIGTFDERFVWNEYIVRSLLDFRSQLDGDERVEFDRCQFVVRIPHVSARIHPLMRL